jgi:hypothetical protein
MPRGVVLLALILGWGVVPTEKLQPKTIEAWNEFVRQAEARIARQQSGESGFLFTDSLAPEQRAEARSQMAAGKVYVLHMGGASREVDGGLIHDWLGAIFLPGAKLKPLLAWVQNYDAHSKYFQEVEYSKLLSREADVFKIYYRFRRKKVVTVYYNTDHTVDYHVLSEAPGAGRAYSRSVATRIAEIQHPGGSKEKEYPVGDDSGFLWRLNSYWQFAETPEGVFLECESISLSRAIPTGLAWAIKGFVETVPEESLVNTLSSIRKGFSGK